MTKKFWTVKEVIEVFEVDERFLSDLEEEELICPLCREDSTVFPAEEMEKLRLAKVLVDEMGVNLPGVEVILHMRQMMFDMRKQFDDILQDLAAQFERKGEKED